MIHGPGYPEPEGEMYAEAFSAVERVMHHRPGVIVLIDRRIADSIIAHKRRCSHPDAGPGLAVARGHVRVKNRTPNLRRARR